MSNALQNKVRAEKDFDIIKSLTDAYHLFALLVTIVCNKLSAIDHMPTKMVKSLAFMMRLSGYNMGLAEFYNSFVARCKVGEVAGLSLDITVLQARMLSAKLIEVSGDKNNATCIDYLTDIKTISDEQFYACLFLHTAGDQYEDCCTTLDNNFTMWSDMIPSTVKGMCTLLENFLKLKSAQQKSVYSSHLLEHYVPSQYLQDYQASELLTNTRSMLINEIE